MIYSLYVQLVVHKPKDPTGTSLESDLPANSSLEILRRSDADDASMKPEDAAAANSGSFKFLGNSYSGALLYCLINQFRLNEKDTISFQSVEKLRLVFPTIQENCSAVSILPHFIEVCGRKIDNTATVLDWMIMLYLHNVLGAFLMSTTSCLKTMCSGRRS